MTLSVNQIRNALSDGLLSFPVTDFDAQGNFNSETFRQRIESFIEHKVSAVFVAGGTGEFFSLSLDEYKQIVDIAVQTVAGRVPVIASAGRSISDAKVFAKAAEEAGCDGILLMPPYLTECPSEGVMAYAKAVIESTPLQVIYYNRANGVLKAEDVKALATACPNLIALKDGVGQMAALNDTVKTVGDRLVYIGGVPTAEIFAEAYLSIGVNTYSSAVFNFMPDMANTFYAALRAGDKATVTKIIQRFFIPFCRLRDRKEGYGVSLIKEGVRLVGQPAGNVRSPLTMPTADEVAILKTIIEANQ